MPIKEAPGSPPRTLIVSLGWLFRKCLVRTYSDFFMPVLSMMVFGFIPALLNTSKERLFSAILFPFLTTISTGISLGLIVPFRNPFTTFDKDHPLYLKISLSLEKNELTVLCPNKI